MNQDLQECALRIERDIKRERPETREDMRQEAWISVMLSREPFDESYGVPFHIFARQRWRSRWQRARALRRSAGLTGLQHRFISDMRTVMRSIQTCEENGPDEQIDHAEKTGIRRSIAERCVRVPVVLDDRPLTDDMDWTLLDKIPSDTAPPDVLTDARRRDELVRQAVNRLPPRERMVITLRWLRPFGKRNGRIDTMGWSLADLSRVLGVSKEMVRLIELNAIQKLKVWLKAEQ